MQNGLTALRDVEFSNDVPEIVQSPNFFQTAAASLAYKYNPIIDRLVETARFPQIAEEGFVAMDHIPEELKPMAASAGLLRATNQEHMDFLAANLRDRMDMHKTLDNSGFFSQIGAEVFDPVNYIALPLRGAKAGVSGAGFIRSQAMQMGTVTAGVTIAQESIRAPFDPLGTKTETAINIGTSFLMGTFLGGLASVPMSRRISAVRRAETEIADLEKLINPDVAGFDASIASSAFTDSVLYKMVSTPMKRVLQSETIPNDVKLTMLRIANDSGILLAGNKQGLALPNSVYQNANLRNNEWVQAYDSILSTWGESTGKGVIAPMDYLYKRADFENWVESVDMKMMQGLKAADEFEQKAMDALDGFYKNWEGRLRESGMIGDAPYFKWSVNMRTERINGIQAEIDDLLKQPTTSLTSSDARHLSRLQASLERNKAILSEHTDALEALKSDPVMPPNEEVFRPRFWDRDAIKANEEKFKQILTDWFTENPYMYQRVKGTGKFERIKLDDTPNAVASRVDRAVKEIMGEIDETDADQITFGAGRSKHFRHRSLDIPNAKVLDFMYTNPVSIMKAYTSRVAPRYEFHKAFGGKSIEDVMDDIAIQMRGASDEEIYAAQKDVRIMYDRIVGSLGRDPSRWDNRLSEGLRTAAQLNFLGSAFAATFSEPAKIVMEHGLEPTLRGLFTVLKNEQLKMGAREGRLAAAALETLMGSAHMRVADDVINNPLRANFWDKAKNSFYLLNGLGPITRLFKDFDAMVRSHTLIDYSVRMTQGKATQQEIEYLARYNIDAEMAQKIANAPWQKGESGLYLANTEAWSDTIEFPATTAEVISGPTNTYDGNRYKPAFYREKENRIYIDEDYIRDVMWDQRGWENPRVEGVRPIKSGIINSPDDLVTFIKMHEIMHTRFRAKDLSLEIPEPKDGFTRIYRFAVKNQQRAKVADWVSESESYQNMIKASGRWFSDSLEEAKWYARENPEGELLYVDIPTKDVEAYRVSNIVQTDDGLDPKSFSARADKELFVPRDVSEKANTYSSLENAAYENAINDLAVAEIEKQPRVSEDTVRTFRNALGSGVMNTIMMGTPADKPIITDGIALIPMRIARQFGMAEDPKYRGYARVESGLLSLPFQFYSYALAATNKTLGAMAHGQLKNQYLGTAIAMGLGYMTLQYKTPDYVEMSPQDQFLRAFDYSGVAALYSDMFYTAMSTSLALGGPNLTGGMIAPRFPQEKDVRGGIVDLMGAGPAWANSVGNGMIDLVSGNVGEGTKEIVRMLPFARLWFIKDQVNRYTNMFAEAVDEPSGYRRY